MKTLFLIALLSIQHAFAWETSTMFQKPTKDELKKKLTDIQYKVTQ